METLAKKLHVIEGSGVHGSIDLNNLTNFPQVIMSPMFKALKFIKYDGTGDLCAHLHMFCRKMALYRDNHPLLCQNFPDSLINPAATWYARLEKTSSWREMANSFVEYYRFNTEIAPNQIILQRTEKKSGKSFREYAKRWCELATQVQPPMMENEMTKWFIDNLKPPYYEKMTKCIDKGIRSKKIMDVESLSSMIKQQVKRMTSRKTKEADVYMVDNASKRPKGVALAYAAPNC